MYSVRRGLGQDQGTLELGTSNQGTLVSGSTDPGTLTLGTSDQGTLTLAPPDYVPPAFGAPSTGTPSNILNCTDATCGSLILSPSGNPSTTPFCGAGSTQWLTGTDNCVLLAWIAGGAAVFALLLGSGKRGRR